MELNWSTFVLEVINFLVLVWILKRFLYQPVLGIIEKRRNNIEQTLNAAQQMHDDAENLQQQYENRLAGWEREKQQQRETLQQDINAERENLFAKLKQELADERKKAAVIEQRHQQELQQQYQEKALNQGARFAAKILQTVTSPELEQQLFLLLIKELSHLSEKDITRLIQTCEQSLDKIVVSSAFQINEDQQQQLEQILLKICKSSTPIVYEQNPELMAGLRISLGSWVIGMNLQDELNGFAALSHEKIDN